MYVLENRILPLLILVEFYLLDFFVLTAKISCLWLSIFSGKMAEPACMCSLLRFCHNVSIAERSHCCPSHHLASWTCKPLIDSIVMLIAEANNQLLWMLSLIHHETAKISSPSVDCPRHGIFDALRTRYSCMFSCGMLRANLALYKVKDRDRWRREF